MNVEMRTINVRPNVSTHMHTIEHKDIHIATCEFKKLMLYNRKIKNKKHSLQN